MKVNEIISENRIDELLPALGKAGKALFKKKPAGLLSTPKAKALRTTLRAKQSADAKALQGLKGAARQKKIAELAMANAKAMQAARGSMEALGPVLTALNILGAVHVIFQYKVQAKYLEDQYNLYLTDREQSIYSSAPNKDEAYAAYLKEHDQAVGVMSAQLAALIAAAPAAKLMKMATGKWGTRLAALAGFTAGVGGGPAGMAIGAAGGVAASAAARKVLLPLFTNKVITTSAKAAILAFFASDAGKKFIEQGILASTLEAVGTAVRVATDMVGQAMASYTGWGASVINPVGQGMSGAVNPNVPPRELSQAEKDQQAANAKLPYSLQSYTKDGALFVGGEQITDNKGNLLPNLGGLINRINSAATSLNVPNPLAKIKIPANYNTARF